MKIAVLISGRGSNLEALLKHQKGYQVCHVISNNFRAKGLETARLTGVVNTSIDWSNPRKAESHLAETLQQAEVELIVLAGFMRILSAEFVHQFSQKIINIHPSLLPKYPGLNTHQKALDHGDTLHGATVHLVDDRLDQGPALSQTTITISQDDDAATLAGKLLPKEHKLLTHTVGLIAAGELAWNADQISYQGLPLPHPLQVE